ncbi:MAG: outer membrane protein assembly factor BamD [Hyphomicrobiaceae bacterium]|jgi:outer membrane protein assembly factor BamD
MSFSRSILGWPASIARWASAILFAVALSACSSSNDNAKLLNPDPPGKMYADAELMLNKGHFSDAAKKFEDIDRDHPYSPEARRAIVMAAYSFYKAGKYPEAIASAQRYTTLHPGTKEAALAHHIIASANFDEIKSPARDQTATRKALNELRVLRQRYPDSPYSKQAENRIRLAEDLLAASEMNVGRYYLKGRNYGAAINRFKVVVTDYQTTAHVEEALYRIVEADLALGIAPDAQATAAVLGHNFPNSSWYKDAYGLLQEQNLSPQHNSGSWIAKAWKTIVPGQKKPEPQPQAVPPGLPQPDQLPPVRGPSEDIPTASTTRSPTKPMGLVQAH